MGLATPLRDLHVTCDVIKAIKKIESHAASGAHSSCLTHDLRVEESSTLYPSGTILSAKEELLWVAANHS